MYIKKKCVRRIMEESDSLPNGTNDLFSLTYYFELFIFKVSMSYKFW